MVSVESEKMSSNLTPEAKEKYQQFLDAKTVEDRIKNLEEFLLICPKDKEYERIIAINRAKLSKLKAEKEATEARARIGTILKEDPFSVKREPHTLQVMLVSDYFEIEGVGKTRLIKNLTGISTGQVGVFTSEPIVGIYHWNKIQFQIVEEPSLHLSGYLTRALGGIRNCDLILLCIDLSRDPISQMENLLTIFRENDIFVNRAQPSIRIEKVGSGGVQIFFLTTRAREQSEELSDFIKEMAKEFGFSNIIVKVEEPVDAEDIEIAFNKSSSFLPAMILATKADVPGSKPNFELLKEKYAISEKTENTKKQLHFEILPVAFKQEPTGEDKRLGLENFGDQILKSVNYIRIFTKSKKGISDKPLILPKNSTVGDVALRIHRDLYEAFKYAMVYRETGPQKKIRAGLQFEMEDNDVIELFTIN